MTFRTSHSKIKAWRTCKNMAHYRYIEKIEPIKKARPLIFGSIGHEMLEEKIEGGKPENALAQAEKVYGNMFREEQEAYGDIIGDLRSVVGMYHKRYANDGLTYLKINGRRAEHEAEIDLGEGVVLIVKLDAIAQTKDGRTWAMEHKFKKAIPDEDERFFDIQTSLYTEFPQSFGLQKFSGVLWDYVRSKAPSVPELLKKGGLSKALRIDTTPEVYLQAIRDNNLNPADYQDILAELKGREDNFSKRVFMPRNAALGKTLASELRQTSLEMEKNLGKDRTRTIERHCKWCSYRLLCRSEMLGLDAEFVRKHDFRKKEKRNEADLKAGRKAGAKVARG